MKEKIKRYLINPILFYIVGILFSFFQITGYILATKKTIAWNVAQIVGISLVSIICGVFIGYIVYLLAKNNSVEGMEHKRLIEKCSEKKQASIWKIAIFSWLIILLCWLPLFITYFPGIGSYDFGNQMLSFLQDSVSTHHPVLHTELMGKLWQWTCTEFQSGTAGIAIYCMLQIVLLSFAFAYAILVLCQLGMSKKVAYIFAVILGVFPLNGYMAISLTKDSIFTSFFVIFFVALVYWIIAEKKNYFYNINILMFLGSLCGVVWFRNNGRYALLVLCIGIFLVAIFDKSARCKHFVIGLVTVIGLTGSMACLNYLERNFWHDPVDANEKYSVPFLQMTRTVAYHKDELPQETVAYLEAAFYEEFWADYNPKLSDQIKDSFDTPLLEDLEFWKIYLELFCEYPGEYLNAFLALNAGYLYVFDTSCHTPYTESNEKGNGYIITNENEFLMETMDIYKHSGFPWLHEWLEDMLTTNTLMKIPVLGQILAPAVWLYVFLFILAYIFTFGKFRHFIPMSFIGGFYITVLLGPVVLMRYVYPIMLCMMIYLFRYSDRFYFRLKSKFKKI